MPGRAGSVFGPSKRGGSLKKISGFDFYYPVFLAKIFNIHKKIVFFIQSNKKLIYHQLFKKKEVLLMSRFLNGGRSILFFGLTFKGRRSNDFFLIKVKWHVGLNFFLSNPMAKRN